MLREMFEEMQHNINEQEPRAIRVGFKRVEDPSPSTRRWDVLALVDKGKEVIGYVEGIHDYVKRKETDRLRSVLAWRYLFWIEPSALEEVVGQELEIPGKEFSSFGFLNQAAARSSLLDRLNRITADTGVEFTK